MATFHSLNSVISWFLANNPARAKYPNIFELEHGGKVLPEDFCTDHPQRLFCEILNAIYGVLNDHPRDARLLFNLCELGRPLGCRIHVSDASKAVRVSERHAYRLLARLRSDLEDDLKRRKILYSGNRQL